MGWRNFPFTSSGSGALLQMSDNMDTSKSPVKRRMIEDDSALTDTVAQTVSLPIKKRHADQIIDPGANSRPGHAQINARGNCLATCNYRFASSKGSPGQMRQCDSKHS